MAERAGDELQWDGAQGERLECAESWRKWGGPGLTPGSRGLCSPIKLEAPAESGASWRRSGEHAVPTRHACHPAP